MTVAATAFVEPGIGLVIWSVIWLLSLPAAAVTAAKGRWGWFAFGFVTVGICWLIGAFQPAAQASLWSRWREGRGPAAS